MSLVEVILDTRHVEQLCILVRKTINFNIRNWNTGCCGVLRSNKLIYTGRGYDNIGQYVARNDISFTIATNLGRYLDDPDLYTFPEKPEVVERIETLMAVDSILIDSLTGEIEFGGSDLRTLRTPFARI